MKFSSGENGVKESNKYLSHFPDYVDYVDKKMKDYEDRLRSKMIEGDMHRTRNIEEIGADKPLYTDEEIENILNKMRAKYESEESYQRWLEENLKIGETAMAGAGVEGAGEDGGEDDAGEDDEGSGEDTGEGAGEDEDESDEGAGEDGRRREVASSRLSCRRTASLRRGGGHPAHLRIQ